MYRKWLEHLLTFNRDFLSHCFWPEKHNGTFVLIFFVTVPPLQFNFLVDLIAEVSAVGRAGSKCSRTAFESTWVLLGPGRVSDWPCRNLWDGLSALGLRANESRAFCLCLTHEDRGLINLNLSALCLPERWAS